MSVHAHRSIEPEEASAHLRQLSDEVSRIASTLSRLSLGPQQAPSQPIEAKDSVPAPSPEVISRVLKARRLRARYFDGDLFADPAWDILLELLYAELQQFRVPVSSLCIAANVPATTALRWITSMTESGLLKRQQDPRDGRRVFIELSPMASDSMRRYFAEIGRPVPL